MTSRGRSSPSGVDILVVAVVFVLSLFGAEAWGGEGGHFRGLAVLVDTKVNEIKAGAGHPATTMMQGEMDGLVFNEAKKGFLDKAHYHVVWSADGTGSGYCYKTFSMPDGSKLFARCEIAQIGPKGGEGTVKLLGGTGNYNGITGSGTFKLTRVSDRVTWDLLEWEYQIP